MTDKDGLTPVSSDECEHDYADPVYSGTVGKSVLQIRTCRKCPHREELTVATPSWPPGGRHD